MGDVDDERRIVLVAERLKLKQAGRVRVHREQAFGDHQNAVFLVLGADLREDVTAVVVVEMPEQMNVVGGGVRAFLKAGMRKHVHDNMVGRPDQSLDYAESCTPSCRIEDDVIPAKKFGNLALERD